MDAYEIGLHRGEYAALIERKPVTVIRDYNRDATLDFLNGSLHTGYFGINIHRAMRQGITPYIEKFSAGCQVFENAADFYKFMMMAEKHRSLYGNRFTYTLIDERAVQRATRRRLVYGSLAVGAGAAATFYLLNRNLNNKNYETRF